MYIVDDNSRFELEFWYDRNILIGYEFNEWILGLIVWCYLSFIGILASSSIRRIEIARTVFAGWSISFVRAIGSHDHWL